MQEFDVRQLRCGTLVCVHDATFDRTTDAARVFGPGLPVAAANWRQVERLDAGSWFGSAHAGERVPTLAEALATITLDGIAMIEHKHGAADAFVAAVRAADPSRCVLQSFDWQWVAQVAALAPELAIALLGPTPQCSTAAAAIGSARAVGAGMVHWHAPQLRRADVTAAHDAGLLVCSYTSDDELAWHGGAALGIDAMCTNDPEAMLRAAAGATRI